MTTDRARDQIRGVIDRLSVLMDARDLAVIDLFSAKAEVMLVGSEPGEMVRGRTAMAGFFAAIFARGSRIRWDWDTVDIFVEAETGWLFAEGIAAIRRDSNESRLPYRLSAVLVCEEDAWRLRLFHGSEPKVA